MQGLYVTNLDLNKSPGYESKFLGQIAGFNDWGININLICFSPNNEICIKTFGNTKNKSPHNHQFIPIHFGGILIRRFHLLKTAFKQIENQNPQFIYFRYPRSEPLFLFFLKLIKIKYPKIIILSEIPTYPYDQEGQKLTNFSQKTMIFLDKTTRNFLKKYIDKIVVVAYQGEVFGISSITIQNGIDVSSTPIMPLQKTLNQAINIIGVGNIEFWHGYDRVILGLQQYYASPLQTYNLNFHIISPETQEIKRLKILVQEKKLSEYVIFHGFQQQDNLEILFAQCQIAIGDLGSYRKGLKETSALKIRDYIARGIPYISCVYDRDIPENFPYCLKVASDDSLINMDDVIQFVEQVYQKPDFALKMREFAQHKLDWSVKLEPVIKFIQEQINQTHSNY